MKHNTLLILLVLVLNISCAPSLTAIPTTAPRPTIVQVATATATQVVLPTATATQTTAPTDTRTATPSVTRTGTPTPTATPKSEIILSPTEILHTDNVSKLRSDIFKRIPGEHSQYTEGDYLYLIHKNVAPDTTIERLDTYAGFEVPVIHVKLGALPPPDSTDLQRAYVNYDRNPARQIDGPWGEEHSFVILNAPARLDYRGSANSTITQLSSLLYRPPDFSYRSFGGVRLFTEADKYYVSVYRVNKPGSALANDLDPRRVEINLRQKYAIRTEVYYNPTNGNKPYIRAYLATFDVKGNKTYQLVGDQVCDDDITNIKGDVSWLGIYSGSSTRNIEIIVGESTVFKLK